MSIDNDKAASSPARVGTIVWGFILVGIAALFFASAQFELDRLNPAILATWVVLSIGALALMGGLAGALLRRK